MFIPTSTFIHFKVSTFGDGENFDLKKKQRKFEILTLCKVSKPANFEICKKYIHSLVQDLQYFAQFWNKNQSFLKHWQITIVQKTL